MIVTPFLSMLYSLVAVIALIGYLPQLVTLAFSGRKAHDISVSTWSIWLGCWAISLAYGVFVIKDWRFCAIAFINVVGHVAILGLTIFNRYFRLARAKAAS